MFGRFKKETNTPTREWEYLSVRKSQDECTKSWEITFKNIKTSEVLVKHYSRKHTTFDNYGDVKCQWGYDEEELPFLVENLLRVLNKETEELNNDA